MRFLDPVGDLRKRQVTAVIFGQHRFHFFHVTDIDFADQLHLHVFLECYKQLIDMDKVFCNSRPNQRLDRCNEQVYDGLFPASEASAVAAREWQVSILVQQNRLQRADALLQVVDPAVLVRRIRQIQPEVPVLPQ